jgi:outer membrane lipoprotein LolB
MNIPKLLLIKLFFAFFVVSCSSLPRSDLAVNADFILEGRIGIRGVGRATSASIRWVQSENNFDMVLWGPLGQGKTRLSGDTSLMTLRSASGDYFEGVVPDEILQRHLGISVPIDAFSVWVLGRPTIHPPAQGFERDESGDLIAFNQLGFNLAYSDFKVVEGQRLPHRIICSEGASQITILVNRWTLMLAQ